jgi:hypothetical protein
MFSSGIRFAPLEDAWNESGLLISPKFENPYKTEPSVIGDVNRRDITHKYLQDLYESKGARAVVSLMEPELVRDIQSMYTPRHSPSKDLSLSIEDMFFIALAVLLFMYVAAE